MRLFHVDIDVLVSLWVRLAARQVTSVAKIKIYPYRSTSVAGAPRSKKAIYHRATYEYARGAARALTFPVCPRPQMECPGLPGQHHLEHPLLLPVVRRAVEEGEESGSGRLNAFGN